MHAHRVDVLDRADDDRVVGHVAHHFELELLPAQYRLLDQGGRGRTRLQRADDHVVDLVAVEHDAAALASQREARPDDDREAQAVDDPPRLFHRARDTALRHLETSLHHGPLEEQAVLAQAQGLDPRAEQLHPGLLERAGLFQRQGQVDPGLAADGRQQRVRPLALDDLHRHVGHEGFDVGRVRDLRVRHDRRRVRVDEDDAVALPAQDTAGLGAGVVELARLADDDRPRTEDQDRLDIRPLRHERAECTGKPEAFPDRGVHEKHGAEETLRPLVAYTPCQRRHRTTGKDRSATGQSTSRPGSRAVTHRVATGRVRVQRNCNPPPDTVRTCLKPTTSAQRPRAD